MPAEEQNDELPPGAHDRRIMVIELNQITSIRWRHVSSFLVFYMLRSMHARVLLLG